mmetsp:Transcript_33121/g.69697  ORF Transcript_33121/g.69697 Transcript_33121/m.69697 type:complete len:404 (+) Transcript_33121:433-1644(+)
MIAVQVRKRSSQNASNVGVSNAGGRTDAAYLHVAHDGQELRMQSKEDIGLADRHLAHDLHRGSLQRRLRERRLHLQTAADQQPASSLGVHRRAASRLRKVAHAALRAVAPMLDAAQAFVAVARSGCGRGRCLCFAPASLQQPRQCERREPRFDAGGHDRRGQGRIAQRSCKRARIRSVAAPKGWARIHETLSGEAASAHMLCALQPPLARQVGYHLLEDRLCESQLARGLQRRQQRTRNERRAVGRRVLLAARRARACRLLRAALLRLRARRVRVATLTRHDAKRAARQPQRVAQRRPQQGRRRRAVEQYGAQERRVRRRAQQPDRERLSAERQTAKPPQLLVVLAQALVDVAHVGRAHYERGDLVRIRGPRQRIGDLRRLPCGDTSALRCSNHLRKLIEVGK